MKTVLFARRALYAALLLTTVAFGVAGCGDDDDGGTGPDITTPAELLDQGWTAFGAGEFTTAKARFQQALVADASLEEAKLGLGWTDLYLGFFDEAEPRLLELAGLLQAPPNQYLIVAAHAGLSMLRLVQDNENEAISAGTLVLSDDPDWVLEHRPTVNADDVRLTVAMAYMRKGSDFFDEAQALADELAPGNGLNPDDDASWVVDGTTYGTHEAALLRLLQSIEAQIGESFMVGGSG